MRQVVCIHMCTNAFTFVHLSQHITRLPNGKHWLDSLAVRDRSTSQSSCRNATSRKPSFVAGFLWSMSCDRFYWSLTSHTLWATAWNSLVKRCLDDNLNAACAPDVLWRVWWSQRCHTVVGTTACALIVRAGVEMNARTIGF